jgi:hypothetical protein
LASSPVTAMASEDKPEEIVQAKQVLFNYDYMLEKKKNFKKTSIERNPPERYTKNPFKIFQKPGLRHNFNKQSPTKSN